jgi:uncharacterized protein YaaN involved in tellurite resistance
MVHSEVVEADAGAEAGRPSRAWMRAAQLAGNSVAKEPDNLVRKMLREIRATLDKHEQRFDEVDERLDDISETLTTSLGLSLHANVRHESVQKLDALEQRIKRLEERV